MRRSTSTVSSKGQVTIPMEIREFLGVEPQSRVAFDVVDNEVRIRKVSSVVDALYGSVPPLDPPRTWKEVEELAREAHTAHAAREGLAE